MERHIKTYGNFFHEFYGKQNQKVKAKIDFVIELIKHVERVPVKFLKHLEGTDGIYEIRVSTVFKQIRIFCFFDKGELIILTNCFIKKKRKTPTNELVLAKKLKKEYFLKKKNIN